jgi:ATP-dependent protease HslVU (ClpYQ) peptidase subunit
MFDCIAAGIGSGAGFAVAAARALMDVPGMTAYSIGGPL